MNTELRKAPPAGAALRCALLGGLEGHSGIYLGRGLVAELQGDGFLQRVTLSEFLNGTEEPTPRSGLRIYAACDAASGRPLGTAEVVARARKIVPGRGRKRPLRYDVLFYNCHRFTAGCVSGRFGGGEGDAFTSDSLLQVVSRCLNGGSAVAWRPVHASTPGFEYAPSPRKLLFKAALKGGAVEERGTREGPLFRALQREQGGTG